MNVVSLFLLWAPSAHPASGAFHDDDDNDGVDRHAQRGEVAEWKWAGKSSRYIHGSGEVGTKR